MCILFPLSLVYRVKKEVIEMLSAEAFDFSLWWIFPVVMIALCYFMMRRGRGPMMCGFGSRDTDSDSTKVSDSAADILDKRYALGEINKEEYEEKKQTLNQAN
jgi:putative membrane protein